MANITDLKTQLLVGNGLARTNRFMVTLPDISGGTFEGFDRTNTRMRNILCTNASLPGRQILTHDRIVGTERRKVAYGYAVDDVTLTFMDTSDLPMRQYFEKWMGTIGPVNENQDLNVTEYPDTYAQRVIIHQLAQPIPLGNVPFADYAQSTYSCALVQAFPTAMSEIAYSNDLDGYATFSVTMSYSWWEQVPAGQLSLSFNF
jgi:hypothetical protein